jgi:hypothetical protein
MATTKPTAPVTRKPSTARGEKVSSKSSVSPARKPINPTKQARSEFPIPPDSRGRSRSRIGKGALPGNKRAVGHKGGGREPIYNPKYHPKVAYDIFLLHCQTTNKQLADLFDVTESTIETWKVRHPEFRKACELKSQVVDAKAARKLSNRINGCKVKAVKIFRDKDVKCPRCKGVEGVNLNCEHCAGSGWGAVIKVPYVEHLPPDVNAAKFWLMNRQGWKENKAGEWEGKLSFGSDEDSIDVSALPVELQKAIYEELQRKKKNGNNDQKGE